MMNIKQRESNSKRIIGIIAAAIILLAGGTYAAYASKIGPFSYLTPNTSPKAANNSDETNPQQKEDIPSVDKFKESGADKTTDEIPAASNGTLEISTLAQRDGSIVYTASLKNTPTPGTCSALFEHTDGAARPVTRTYPSVKNACPETAIPQAEFVALGDWKLTLRYYVNNTQLVTTETFEVK